MLLPTLIASLEFTKMLSCALLLKAFTMPSVSSRINPSDVLSNMALRFSSDCIIFCSAVFLSVISRAIFDAPTTTPLLFITGDTVNETNTLVPSFFNLSVS
jgi:hypothetical protein